MTTELGFILDENNVQLKKVFENHTTFKRVYIDIYPENPLNPQTSFMLLLRTSAKNPTILNDNNRLIIIENDRFGTHLMNILFSKIKKCFYNKLANNHYEFILNIQNIYYRLIVFN